MIVPNISDVLGSSFIFYFVTESHIIKVACLDFFSRSIWHRHLQVLISIHQHVKLFFLIFQYLVVGIFEHCSGPFYEFMSHWVRLVIATPTKISFPRFFVWLSKVMIPARPWGYRAFLPIWNTSFISVRQAVHNAPIHSNGYYGCDCHS